MTFALCFHRTSNIRRGQTAYVMYLFVCFVVRSTFFQSWCCGTTASGVSIINMHGEIMCLAQLNSNEFDVLTAKRNHFKE